MRKNVFLIVVLTLAMIYALGEIAQGFTELPRCVRWHMSDLGFVGCWAIILAGIHAFAVGWPGRLRFEKRRILLGAVIGWAAATLDECYLGIVFRGAHLDPIDLGCFTVAMAAIAIAYRLDPRQVWEI